ETSIHFIKLDEEGNELVARKGKKETLLPYIEKSIIEENEKFVCIDPGKDDIISAMKKYVSNTKDIDIVDTTNYAKDIVDKVLKKKSDSDKENIKINIEKEFKKAFKKSRYVTFEYTKNRRNYDIKKRKFDKYISKFYNEEIPLGRGEEKYKTIKEIESELS